jgi:hypothetical protein
VSVGAIIVIAIAATGMLLMRFRKRWLAKINIAFTNRRHPPFPREFLRAVHLTCWIDGIKRMLRGREGDTDGMDVRVQVGMWAGRGRTTSHNIQPLAILRNTFKHLIITTKK